MENVWKIGSRWSEFGSWESRIISIFRRSEVVFLGNEAKEKFNDEVKKGDYFAIADGYDIPAVAKAISGSIPLNTLITNKIIKVRKDEPFALDGNYDGCYGVRVKIVDLPEGSHLYYRERKAFVRAYQIAEKVISLYNENLSTKFDIKAKTYRIMPTSDDNMKDDKSSIINRHTFYNIPIYQREYSWTNEQIEKFVCDIFNGYWGSDDDKEIKREPMFIGTMQLSFKKFISKDESEQDVIDGQQRLSTIICILKYLQLKYPEDGKISKIPLDWMETRVNNGKEEEYLDSMLNINSLEDISNSEDYEQNMYIKNLKLIKEKFEEITTNEQNKVLPLFDIQGFVDYILNDIYFVVVETVAGLSKTIQIFNTINTSGLDLNGNDLFKVRLYEYLHDVKNAGEDTFNEINEIYKDIKEKNKEWHKNHDWNVVSMGEIRSIYKNYLISKYKLSTALYSKSTDTFFDELFDVLLNVQNHQDMKDLKGLELSLDDITRIGKVEYLWNSSDYHSYDEFISYKIIKHSRYSRYTDIAYQILLQNEALTDDERINQVYEIFHELSRLFFCWSIMYAKAVNEIHTFMYGLYRDIANFETEQSNILDKIKTKVNRNNNNDSFKNKYIGQVIANNRTWKDLICSLSAYLDEIDNNTTLEDFINKFENSIDIEHIHASANKEECSDIEYDLQNSIGNLMVLEYNINRSIGKLPFNEKKERSGKKLCYKDSIFATVKKISESADWGIEEIKQRKESEINRISKFLFGQ